MAGMTFEDVRRRVTIAMPDTVMALYDDRLLNDAIFKALRDVQEECRCSRMKVRKTLPKSSYAITAGTKTGGTVVLTLNERHEYDELQPVDVVSGNAEYDGSFGISSIPAYNQIQYVFKSNSSGAIASGVVNTPELFMCNITPEFQGIDYHRDTANTANEKKNKFKVDVLNVDMVWELTSEGKLNPFAIGDAKQIQLYKDDPEWRASVDAILDMAKGAIEFDKDQIRLESPVDLRSKTLEFWIRFAVPYIQDAHVTQTGSGAVLMDSMIQTIPVRFHERLTDSIKYNVYCMINERSEGKYEKIVNELYAKRGIDMNFIRAESAVSPALNNIQTFVPQGVFVENE